MTEPERLDRSAWPTGERRVKKPEFAELGDGERTDRGLDAALKTPGVEPPRPWPAAGYVPGDWKRVRDGSEIPPTVIREVALGREMADRMKADLLQQAERYANMTGVPARVEFGAPPPPTGRFIEPEPKGPDGLTVCRVLLAAAGLAWLVFGFAVYWPAPVSGGYAWGLLGLVVGFVLSTWADLSSGR